MSTYPSAPPSQMLDPNTLPPSYDEAVRNVATEQIRIDTSVLQPPTQIDPQDELNIKRKEDEEERKKQMLGNAGAPIVTQPRTQTEYIFPQSNPQEETHTIPPQVPQSNDCVICCYMCGPEDIADTLYCIFCCSRHVTGHDGGCCNCGEHCCSCPDGCCECGDNDCDCGDCDCDCGDCDCDCGDCNCDCGDCNCDCGDCTIL